MYYMDLRHAILIVINVLKYQVGNTWVWDPFNTIAHPTGSKSSALAILWLIFSFTRIEVPSRPNMASIIVRLGQFDPCLAILLVASIFLPQVLFWYVHLIIIMIMFCPSWFLNVLVGSFLGCLGNVLTSIPVINIIIRAGVARWHNLEPQHEVEDLDDANEVDAAVEVEALDDAVQVIVE